MRYQRYSNKIRHRRYERHTAEVVPSVILVTGATISTNTASPAPNNVPVQFTVQVTPENAENKTGIWSISVGGTIAAIDQNGRVTPVGGTTFGNITVKWTANDAGKFEATYNFRFEEVSVPEGGGG